jgi:hypothetical protein
MKRQAAITGTQGVGSSVAAQSEARLQLMHSSRTSIPLWCFAATAIACTEDARVDKAETPLLLTAEQPENPVPAIGAQQRALLRALADETADPTPYMLESFTLVDYEDPRERRELGGRYRVGSDRWQVLARRVPADYAVVVQMEVMLQRQHHAVVIARHPTVRPTVTHWGKTGDKWKASWMTINMPEEVLAELRRRTREDMIEDSARR